MQHCYHCGQALSPKAIHLRRKVRTGERIRKRYGAHRPSTVSVQFGSRILCKRCARRWDRERLLEELKRYLPEFWILVILLVAILLT